MGNKVILILIDDMRPDGLIKKNGYIRNFVTKLGELVVISNKIIIIGTNFP